MDFKKSIVFSPLTRVIKHVLILIVFFIFICLIKDPILISSNSFFYLTIIISGGIIINDLFILKGLMFSDNILKIRSRINIFNNHLKLTTNDISKVVISHEYRTSQRRSEFAWGNNVIIVIKFNNGKVKKIKLKRISLEKTALFF